MVAPQRSQKRASASFEAWHDGQTWPVSRWPHPLQKTSSASLTVPQVWGILDFSGRQALHRSTHHGRHGPGRGPGPPRRARHGVRRPSSAAGFPRTCSAESCPGCPPRAPGAPTVASIPPPPEHEDPDHRAARRDLERTREEHRDEHPEADDTAKGTAHGRTRPPFERRARLASWSGSRGGGFAFTVPPRERGRPGADSDSGPGAPHPPLRAPSPGG